MLFARWFGEDSNVSDMKLEDMLNYKVLLEMQYSLLEELLGAWGEPLPVARSQ